MTKALTSIQKFIKSEATAGLILMFAAVMALIINNTVLAVYYDQFLTTKATIQIGALDISKPLLLWINDGLMAIFFFLVGLEIKREILEGELSSFSKASLPIFAAIGGMLGPALIFLFINQNSPETVSGWAIPAATDIAFALGILALLGTRAPVALKIFLLAVAIIDDLGAIMIIALFYTENLSVNALGLAAIGFAGLMILNQMKVMKMAPYILLGIFMWVCVLKSGVHATLAGVLVAFMIPLRHRDAGEPSPLKTMEHGLHPWIVFAVLPLFAFANAGVSLAGISVSDMAAPLPLGIAMGLIFGKQIGVLLFAYLAVKLRFASLPTGLTWWHIYGVACLTGVGFTMSLFIGTLAFDSAEMLNQVRLGVLMGSIASGVLGYTLLRVFASRRAQPISYEPTQETLT